MLAALVRASLDGAVIAALVWALSRCCSLSPATRTALWWCAGAKFLLGLWIVPIALPVLPWPATVSIASVVSRDPARGSSSPQPLGSVATAPDRDLPSPQRLAIEPSPIAAWFGSAAAAVGGDGWLSRMLTALWLTGVLGSLVYGARGWRLTRTAVRRSLAAPAAVHDMAADLAADMGLRRLPALRLSADVETPLVTGFRRPVILLPTGRFERLPARQQQMALCHELLHVKRRDLWFGCAPALAERLFFFHPLAHLAAREYAFWREAACDDAVLGIVDATPHEYGRLLLNLGVTRPGTGLAAAGASWSFSNLKRRIVMLRDPLTVHAGSRIVPAVALALAVTAMLPLHLAARPRPSPSPEPPPRVEASATMPDQGAAGKQPPAQRERDLKFVMFVDDNSTTMSGSTDDMRRARALRRGGEQMLWFRRAGREYVVRDPALLARVLDLWKPVGELGDQQGVLGTKQGVLGTKQGELGTRQGELGTEQGRLGTRQGRLGERQGAMAAREGRLSEAQRDAFDRERRNIEREMRELDREMRQLDVKMRELDRPMRELDGQMQVLGKEMEVLGRQMEEASKRAETEMATLLDQAIATGVAQPVK